MRRTCLNLHCTPGSAFTEPSGFCVAARTSLYEREEPTMANLSQVAQGERTARMALSMIVEPDDAVTGRILGELVTIELFWLAERDDAVPGLRPLTLRCGVPSCSAQTLGHLSRTS